MQRLASLMVENASSPRSLNSLLPVLHEATDLLRKEIAEQLQPALNEYLRSPEHSTYHHKRRAAKFVNAECAYLGLVIRCPRSGEPAFLMGSPGSRPVVGRWQLDARVAERGRVRTWSGVEPPALWLEPVPSTNSGPGRHRRTRT